MNAAHLKRDLTKMSIPAIMSAYRPDRAGPEITDHDLFHRRTYLAAGTYSEMVFFTESEGNQDVSGQLTNMQENGKMEDGKHFLIEGIDLTPIARAAAEADRVLDLNELLDTGRVQIVYGKDVVYDGRTLRHYVSRTALIGVDANVGDQEPQYFMLANPIALPSGKNFKLRVVWPEGSPALTANVDLEFALLGQLMSEAKD